MYTNKTVRILEGVKVLLFLIEDIQKLSLTWRLKRLSLSSTKCHVGSSSLSAGWIKLLRLAEQSLRFRNRKIMVLKVYTEIEDNVLRLRKGALVSTISRSTRTKDILTVTISSRSQPHCCHSVESSSVFMFVCFYLSYQMSLLLLLPWSY